MNYFNKSSLLPFAVVIGLGLFIGIRIVPPTVTAIADAARTNHKKRKHRHHIRTPSQQAHIRSHRRYATSHPRDTRIIHGTNARHILGERVEGDIPGHHITAGSDHPVNDPIGRKPIKKFIGGEMNITDQVGQDFPTHLLTKKYPKNARVTFDSLLPANI